MRRALGLLIVAACSSPRGEDPPAPSAQPTTAPTSTAAPTKDAGPKDAGPHAANESLQRCAASKGDLGSIADAITRLNAISGKGGDAACFVATLPRPLAVVATLNMGSAQPAGGRGAPRIFFMLPKLVVAAVPEGQGSTVLEFGEWTGTTTTIKGEIAMPVTVALAPDAAFKKVLQGNDRTTCATCHGQEARHPTIPDAFVSLALKPTPASELSLEDLEEIHELCVKTELVSPRCNFFHALFDFGEITQGAFSPVVGTFN
ncbi:MAG: hypothetical protein KF819_37210 [Labilithrix sp.]|nr:hypothetical protein [Labilithrix sp.]